MLRKPSGNNNDTFWISYADLMAGLLFIFVLLVGAIIIKYLFLQQDIKAISQELIEKQSALQISLEALEEKKKSLDIAASRLTQLEREAIQSALLISQLKAREQELLARQEALRRLSDDLNTSFLRTMADLDMTRDSLNSSEQHLQLTRAELETLSKQLLTLQDDHVRLQNSYSTLNEKHDEQSRTLFLKEQELTRMAAQLLQKTREHQSVVEQLDLTKLQIRHLTGIRIKVINALKNSVGNKIRIDPKNGSIRFNSGVFFEQNGAVLTEQAKRDLKVVLNEYIDTLMHHPDIAPYLDRIDIVGYSNSDGEYLYNLQLSQKRAYVVLEYLLSLDFRYSNALRRVLSATGRGYNDLIFKDGVEDKDASRRIEIKFRLKDEDAIAQIEKILGE